MKLFTLKDYKIQIEPEALLLAPFGALWDRDKTKQKIVAYMEIGYIWFMNDIKSDFFEILNEKEREAEVKAAMATPKGWKPDKLVKEASVFYQKRSETLIYKLLLDSRSGLEHLSNILKNPDFDKIDIKKVSDTIRALPQVVEALRKLEETVLKEQDVKAHKGSQEKAVFEDGI